MKEFNRKALRYFILGAAAVGISAIGAHLLAPETGAGDRLRFFIPVAVSLLSGLGIFLKLRQESDL